MDDEVRHALEVLARATKVSSAASPTIGELWAAYREWGFGLGNLPGWTHAQHYHWVHLEAWFAHRRALELTHEDLDRYREHRRKQTTRRKGNPAPATRNRELGSLLACLNWARKRRLIPYHPLTGASKEPERNARNVYIPEAALQKLIAMATPHAARVLILVAYDSGMRQGEIRRLEWDRCFLSQDVPHIVLGDGDVKNGSGRIVPLTDRAADELSYQPRWSRLVFPSESAPGPVSTTAVHRWWHQALERAGLPHTWHYHDLRHSAETNLRRSGVDYKDARAILGHKSHVAAARYGEIGFEDMRRALVSLEEHRKREPVPLAGLADGDRRGPLRSVAKHESSPVDRNSEQSTAKKS